MLGVLLQCWLIFSHRSSLFTSHKANINYFIILLWGRALVWAQASSDVRLDSLPLKEFIKRFEQIFDRADL